MSFFYVKKNIMKILTNSGIKKEFGLLVFGCLFIPIFFVIHHFDFLKEFLKETRV